MRRLHASRVLPHNELLLAAQELGYAFAEAEMTPRHHEPTPAASSSPAVRARPSLCLNARCSSWLDVERWSAELTATWITRVTGRSVRDLTASIRTERANPRRNVWQETDDEILDILAAYRQRINDSGH
jgi:hypothetical protein